MPDSDAGFKIVARAAGRRLPQLAGVTCDKYEPIGGEVQATERLADRAFRAELDGEPFVIYMEAYTRWEKAAPWSVLAKSGLLSERERLPTLSLVYVLLPKGYRPQQGKIHLTVAGATSQLVRFKQIPLWRKKPEPWWEESPGLMALYPLCRHERSPHDALTHAAGVIRAGEPDSLMRSNLLTTLALFGRLVNRGSGIDVVGLIGRQHMKESPLYQEIMEEGGIEARRAVVQEVLEERFGAKDAATFATVLHGINDKASLTRLRRLAARCRRLTEFRKGLAAEAAAR